MNRKKNSIRILAAGMEQFEAKQQQADFSTLETFLAAYLNTPGRKQRKQLAEEFQKRHLELHQFLKSHPDLLTAETELQAMIAGEQNESRFPTCWKNWRRDCHDISELFSQAAASNALVGDAGEQAV